MPRTEILIIALLLLVAGYAVLDRYEAIHKPPVVRLFTYNYEYTV